MATSSQGDPRVDILNHLIGQVQLTDEASQMIQIMLKQVDAGQLQSPAALDRAFESMDRLAAHLKSQRGLGPADAQSLQFSLGSLCPLFPVC